MKKLIVFLAIFLCSLTSYAATKEEAVDIDGLSVVELNNVSADSFVILGHSSGAISAGICRIIIRSNEGTAAPGLFRFPERFTFTYSNVTQPETVVTPIMANYVLMFKLQGTDFSWDQVRIISKDGRSIGENIKELMGDRKVAVMAGPCYRGT